MKLNKTIPLSSGFFVLLYVSFLEGEEFRKTFKKENPNVKVVSAYWLMITRTCWNSSHVYAADPMVGAAELSIINGSACYMEPFRVV
ncbi:hypothetical protein Hanom_Chr16g01459521 [Helianthus anomalus]